MNVTSKTLLNSFYGSASMSNGEMVTTSSEEEEEEKKNDVYNVVNACVHYTSLITDPEWDRNCLSKSRFWQCAQINKYLLDDYLQQYMSLEEDEVRSFYPQITKLMSHQFRCTLRLVHSTENAAYHHYGLPFPSLIGYATFDFKNAEDKSLVKIYFFEILPQFRRMKLGRQMEKHIVNFLREKGVKRVELLSTERSIGFWEKLGYTFFAGDYGCGYGEQNMEKTL